MCLVALFWGVGIEVTENKKMSAVVVEKETVKHQRDLFINTHCPVLSFLLMVGEDIPSSRIMLLLFIKQ